MDQMPSAAPAAPDATTTAAPADLTPSEKTIELAQELAVSIEADKHHAVDEAAPAAADSPAPVLDLGVGALHRDGRHGVIASLRRNDNGEVEAVRLQLGEHVTDWLLLGEVRPI